MEIIGKEKKKLSEINGYQVIEEIARGTYGIVSKVQKNERLYAMKKCLNDHTNFQKPVRRKTGGLHETALRECNFYKKYKHPHIMPVHDIFIGPCGHLHIIGELAEQTLSKFIEQSTNEQRYRMCAQIMWPILNVLCFLHLETRHLYKDLKPNNVLLKQGHVYLADFGSVGEIGRPEMTEFQYSDESLKYFFCAPECRKNRYDELCDSWSFGCLMLDFLENIYNRKLYNFVKYFEQIQMKSKLRASANRSCRQLWWDDIRLLDLLSLLIQEDPKKRRSLVRIREHPFFDQVRLVQPFSLRYGGDFHFIENFIPTPDSTICSYIDKSYPNSLWSVIQRNAVIMWLLQYSSTFHLKASTVFLSILLMDRYLTLDQIQDMTENMILLIATTCFLIACKVKERDFIDVETILNVFLEKKFHEHDIVTLEKKIISTLGFITDV